MRELIAAFANWMQNTSVGMFVAGSTWAYPFVQLIHFSGLSIWLGTIAGLDLHLLGVGNRRQTSAEFLRATIVWNWLGLALAATGGLLLFSTAATTFVVNPAFEIKIAAILPVALAWHIVVQVKTFAWGETAEAPKVAKFAGAVELILWLCMATAAATIPYF